MLCELFGLADIQNILKTQCKIAAFCLSVPTLVLCFQCILCSVFIHINSPMIVLSDSGSHIALTHLLWALFHYCFLFLFFFWLVTAIKNDILFSNTETLHTALEKVWYEYALYLNAGVAVYSSLLSCYTTESHAWILEINKKSFVF